MTVEDLPIVNATLNGLSAILLAAGFTFIRRKNIPAHRFCMLSAVVTSTIFLACYLTFHYYHGSTRFQGQGAIWWIYFSILLSHTILAIVVVPLVLTTLYRALKGQFDRHKRIARWTLPIWFYVSVTGVVIYLMLYQIPFATPISHDPGTANVF